MPGPVDGVARRVTRSLARRMGMPVTMQSGTAGGYDAATGAVGGASAERVVWASSLEAYPEDAQRGANASDETAVRVGDMKLTLPALEVEPDVPTQSTLWVIAGDTWRTVKVDPEFANQLAYQYVCHIRK